jgi:hypothetical protein
MVKSKEQLVTTSIEHALLEMGKPVDILFIWYYIVFSFGVYSHIVIFKNHRKDPYKNIDELR